MFRSKELAVQYPTGRSSSVLEFCSLTISKETISFDKSLTICGAISITPIHPPGLTAVRLRDVILTKEL